MQDTEEKPLNRKQLLIVSTVTYVENAPENYEHPSGKSLTVPDMSMSIQDLLEKYVQGNPVDNMQIEFFDDKFPDITYMSKTDLLEAQQQLRDEMKVIQDRIEQQQLEESAQSPIMPENPDDPDTSVKSGK